MRHSPNQTHCPGPQAMVALETGWECVTELSMGIRTHVWIEEGKRPIRDQNQFLQQIRTSKIFELHVNALLPVLTMASAIHLSHFSPGSSSLATFFSAITSASFCAVRKWSFYLYSLFMYGKEHHCKKQKTLSLLECSLVCYENAGLPTLAISKETGWLSNNKWLLMIDCKLHCVLC